MRMVKFGWLLLICVLGLVLGSTFVLAGDPISMPLEGKGTISGNSGTFSYSNPIEIPPGRHGLVPELGFSYSSSGGDGFLGMGWDIPLGQVIRGTKKGVDYSCVSSTANSCFVFMLGGASSELIPRTDWCSDCYGAKIENSFIQFRFINNTYWQAIDKSGTKYLFGQTAASRQDNPSDSTQVFKWAEDTTTDTHNNAITYSYFKDQGDIYIDKIDYQTNHIVFLRDSSRTDKPTLYGPNFAVITAYRLSEIDIYANWNGSAGTLYKKYVLGYCGTAGVNCVTSSTQRSILGKVTPYGSNGTSARPDITFEWPNKPVKWQPANYNSGPSATVPIGNQCLSGDLDGDGKIDIWCETGSGSGLWDVRLSFNDWQPQTWNGSAPAFPISNQCLTGDLDGDGRTDFWCETGSASGSWDVRISTGSSWTSSTPWGGSAPVFPIGNQCLTGDLNGDGKTDFWCETTSASGSWDVRISTGSSWTSSTPWGGSAPAFPIGNQCFTGDLNGDGKTDFWCETWSGSGSWDTRISTGSSWTSSTPWGGSAPVFPIGNQCLTGDLNGDGKTDFWCETADSSGQWDVRLSTGSGWAAGTWAGPAPGLPVRNQCLSGDLNGDGKVDFWCQTAMGSGSWDTRLSMGNSWVIPPPPVGGQSVDGPGAWSTAPPMSTPRFTAGVGVWEDTKTMYVVGGSNGNNYFSTVEAYNPLSHTWSAKASMSTARNGLGVGFANGNIYAIGGYNGSSYLQTVEAMVSGNNWITKSPMPTARSGLAVGVINGILYAVGGYNGSSFLSTVEAYDPVGDHWTTKASMPTARSGLAVGVVNGILYAVGGWNGSSYFSTVEAYNPITDSWTGVPSMPTARVGLGVGVVNGVLYAIGGMNSSLQALSTVEAYNSVTNSWTTKNSMPTARRASVGVVDGIIFAVGGLNGLTFLSTAEALTPPSVSDMCQVGELNGYGTDDFWCFNSGTLWVKNRTYGNFPDLMTGVFNGFGGKTYITYNASTEFWSQTDTGWNLPFIISVADGVIFCAQNCLPGGPLGSEITVGYSFKGAYYNSNDREFRGFAYTSATNVADLSMTETWYHQGNGTSTAADSGNESPGYTSGLAYRQLTTDTNHVVRSQKDMAYMADADGLAPYFTPLSQEDNWICDAPNTCKQMRTVYNYDSSNGNLIRQDQYGDLSTTTDDRTLTYSYSPNTSLWILALPTSKITYQGIGTATQVDRTDFYYDGVSDCNTASTNQTPTKGDLTRAVRWLSGGTSPESRTAYDTFGNLVCSRDANGNTATYSYDGSATLQKVATNALNQTTTLQYYGVDGVAADTGIYGQVKSITDPNGAITTTTYDVFGRKTQVTSPNALVRTWAYPCVTSTGCVPDNTNLFGWVGSQYINESGGGLSALVYFDGLGRTITEKKTGAGTSLVRTDTNYNNLGQVFRKTLPYFDGGSSNGDTQYSYDSIGRISQVFNQDTSRRLFCYSLWSISTIDASNHMKREISDAFGRVIQVDEYTGSYPYTSCPTSLPAAYATTLYTYDVLGNLRFVNDTKGNQVENRYDTLSRKTYMHDPDMGTWTYQYDGAGNMISQIDAKAQTIGFAYDALNRKTVKTAGVLVSDNFNRTTGLGTGWRIYYPDFITDGASAVSSGAAGVGKWAGLTQAWTMNDYSVESVLTLPAGSHTSGIIARGRTSDISIEGYVAQLDVSGSVNLFRRSPNGVWTLLKTAAATITAGTPYKLKLLVTGSNPVNLSVYFQGGLTLTYADSAANRVISGIPGIQTYDPNVKYDYFTVAPDGSSAFTVTYNYDQSSSTNGKGRITSVSDPSGSSNFYYNNMGWVNKIDKIVDGTAYTTQTGYDTLGRISTTTYPDNSVVSYAYNGPLIDHVYEGATTYAQYSGYNVFGQPTTVAFGNGVTTTYTYSNTSNGICPQQNFRLCTISMGTYQTLTYGYDNGQPGEGNVTSIANSVNGNQTFIYDELNRLQSATGPYGTLSYAYSELGNMLCNSQISACSGTSPNYTYPAYGVSSVRPHAVTTAGPNSYLYDSNGNMTSGAGRTINYDVENRPTSITNSNGTTSFIYDGDGGRVKKTSAGTTVIYIGKLYECTGGACSKHIFVGNQRIALKTIGTSNIKYYHSDQVGSSSVVTDETGAQFQNLAYYPFGQTRVNSLAPASGVFYKYTGQMLDDSTGLYFYGARYYDPALERFISADTIVPEPSDPQALNRYAYARNNPINLADPSGHGWWKHLVHQVEDVGRAISVDVRHLDNAIDVNAGHVEHAISVNAHHVRVVGPLALQAFGGPIGMIVGSALLTKTTTGRAILSGEIVVGTAIATSLAGCPECSVAVQTALGGALAGEVVGGGLGAYSAQQAGGNITDGVFFGVVAGGITGAAASALVPGSSSFLTNSLLGAGKGAVLGVGEGATVGYAGGKGDVHSIIAGAAIGALIGAAAGSNLGPFEASGGFSDLPLVGPFLQHLAFQTAPVLTYGVFNLLSDAISINTFTSATDPSRVSNPQNVQPPQSQ